MHKSSIEQYTIINEQMLELFKQKNGPSYLYIKPLMSMFNVFKVLYFFIWR